MPTAPTALPPDYAERVYAGVLGKIIGVYLGRPFEGWTHHRIMQELGMVTGYVHERFDVPLVVADDDISGTFTFLRALEDHGYDPDLTAAEIGDAWLNYLVEGRTILWWGGVGTSTEHTAYHRLNAGIRAPESGSIARNGRIIAQQIGAQIFIDGWAMLFPGDPERAVDFARRAASVSHDGEAIYGAQVVAAIEAQAFVEPDIDRLLDTALQWIPGDSTIARVAHDIRAWHAAAPDDWKSTRTRIERSYGYDRYGGACHVVPNHALIIHALLHGEGDFSRSLSIVNSCGWDTDCNSGNVGAILGIRNGLSGIDEAAVDWRGPVADRLYLSTAEGGRGISDALSEAERIVTAAHCMRGTMRQPPKDGARFHFSRTGSVQGFAPETAGVLDLRNEEGRLELTLHRSGTATATTPTFIPEDVRAFGSYGMFASPSLHPGQDLSASVEAMPSNRDILAARLVFRIYGAADAIEDVVQDKVTRLKAGEATTLRWRVPDTGGYPIMAVGLQIAGGAGDALLLDALTWNGSPTVSLRAPDQESTMWRRAWINGADQFTGWRDAPYRLSSDRVGLVSQGSEEWLDYTAHATVTVPFATSAGIAARVGGMRRYHALLIGMDGVARLVTCLGTSRVLAEAPVGWDPERGYDLEITVEGESIRGLVDGGLLLEATVQGAPRGGGVGLLVEAGTLISGPVSVRPGRTVGSGQ